MIALQGLSENHRGYSSSNEYSGEQTHSRVDTVFVFVDAGYCTLSNMNELFRAHVNLVRTWALSTSCSKIVKKHPDACTPGNRTAHNGRLEYTRHTEIWLTDTNSRYAYTCTGSIRETREEDSGICLRTQRVLDRRTRWKIRIGRQVYSRLTLNFFPRDVLVVLYMKQSAE